MPQALKICIGRSLNPAAHTSCPCRWILVLDMRVCHRETKWLPLRSDFLQDHCVSPSDLYTAGVQSLENFMQRKGILLIFHLGRKTERLQYLGNQEIEDA